MLPDRHVSESPHVPPASQGQFGSYEAMFVPGSDGRNLVLALTGVGNVSKPYDNYDFTRSLQQRKQLSQIFIRDHSRSWYRNPEGRLDLIAWCRQQVRTGTYQNVTIIGVSMGAYAALSLGTEFPEARVIALSPPYSLDTNRFGRGVVRHKIWLDQHPQTTCTDASSVGDPARYLILFGDDEMIDIYNLRLFQENGWKNVFVCPGGEHNLGTFLSRQRRLDDVLDLAFSGTPMSEVAASAGAYAAFAQCQALQILSAREALWRGDFLAADEALSEARFALGAISPALTRLDWLRGGLTADPDKAARTLRALPPACTLHIDLGGGAKLHLRSSEARLLGGVPMLGPAVLARLTHSKAERIELTFRASAPGLYNPAGSLALEAYTFEHDKFELLASSPDPKVEITIPLRLRDGAVEFFLRRRCFGSGFDAERNDDQIAWAMKLRDVYWKAL